MRKLTYIIDPSYDGKKLYSYLKGTLRLSSSLIRTLKTMPEGLLLNGSHIRTIDPVKTGDELEINLPEDKNAPLPSDIPMNVVYEDEDILVINKGPYLAVHETHNHQGDTLANAFAAYCEKKGEKHTFRAVGRLDKGTSGLMLIALNAHAAAALNGKIKKTYLAAALGETDPEGTIDAPVYRPDPMKTVRCVDGRGDPAVTNYVTLEQKNGVSLVKVSPVTGRTHQIRVHFAHIGHPLIGDRMYGEESGLLDRHALHCCRMEFFHPVTGEKMIIEAMPDKEYDFIERLFGGKGERHDGI